MKKLGLVFGILVSLITVSGTASAGHDVGVSFAGPSSGEQDVNMDGSLSGNNLSCKADQACQDKFDKVHSSAEASFTGCFAGEVSDADGNVRDANFCVGIMHLLDTDHRIVYEFDEESYEVRMIWVDPASKIDPDIPLPTLDL